MVSFRSMIKPLGAVLLAGGSLVAMQSAVASTIAWASWSNPVAGSTTGSAQAAFGATGLTAGYAGELRALVANYPSYAPAATFSGGTVGNAPPQANGIVQIFGGTAAGTNTITFSSAVVNPVMAIWSLGQPGNFVAQFNFDHAFTIESGGANAEYGGAALSAVGNNLFGAEGNGTIQFTGTVTSISWTNPVFESWYGFTVGVPITAAIPEPETYALMLAGLGLLGLIASRRRKPL